MKKILFVIFLLTAVMHAQTAAVNGYCELGASKALISGLGSSNYQQGLIPYCTVTVYLTGTTTLATIYSDSSNTPLANPFTANENASWMFYALSTQEYDVVFDGGVSPNTYPNPVTLVGITTGTSVCTNCVLTTQTTTQIMDGPLTVSANNVITITAPPYSADNTGVTDDTAIINTAATAAASSGQALYFPPGTYKISGQINFAGIRVFGNYSRSIFHCATTTGTLNCQAYMTGDKVSVDGLSWVSDYTQTKSSSGSQAWAIQVNGATNFAITNNIITGSTTATNSSCTGGTETIDGNIYYLNCGIGGIVVWHGSYGQMHGNVIRYSLADGVMFSNGTNNVIEYGDQVYNSGDDCFSIDSYISDSAGTVNHNVRSSLVCNGSVARGFEISGGDSNQYIGGQVSNVALAGVFVASELQWLTRAATNTQIIGVHIDSAGSIANFDPCISIRGRSGYVTDNVIISGVTAVNCRLWGMDLGEENVISSYGISNIKVEGTSLSGASSNTAAGIYINGANNVTLTDVTLNNFGGQGVYSWNSKNNNGFLKINGLHCNKINTSGVSGPSCVLLNSTNFSDISVDSSRVTNGTNALTYLLYSLGTGAISAITTASGSGMTAGTYTITASGSSTGSGGAASVTVASDQATCTVNSITGGLGYKSSDALTWSWSTAPGGTLCTFTATISADDPIVSHIVNSGDTTALSIAHDAAALQASNAFGEVVANYINNLGSFILNGVNSGTVYPSTSTLQLGNSSYSLTLLGTSVNARNLNLVTASSSPYLYFNSSTANTASQINFADAGTLTWQIIKNAANSFVLYDATTTYNPIVITSSGNSTFGESASVTVVQGSSIKIGSSASNTVYRCTTAGTLPIGALTINSASCGASIATNMQLQ